MLSSYWMVSTHIVLSLLLIIGIISYRYIFPKKPLPLFAVLIIVSLLPVVSLLRFGDYESGDFNTHIYRSMAFFHALKDGEIIPSWAAKLNATYGYPLFIFLNPLPYYFVSFFHLLGFSFINSMKLLLGASFIFSGITMYLFAKEITRNSLAAFTAGVFYLFTPYHLIDMHFRVAVGEVLAFAIVPLPFYFLKRYKETNHFRYIVFAGFALGMLYLSHQAIALYLSGILFFFIMFSYLVLQKNLPNLAKSMTLYGIALVLSFFTLYPHLAYPKYTYAYLLYNQLVSFPKLSELFYVPWRSGFLFQGPNGEIPSLIGYTQLFLIVALVYLFFKKRIKHHHEQVLFWLVITLGLIYMLTPLSKVVWQTVPILNTTQFASRLLLPLTFCIAILAGYFVLQIKKGRLFTVLFIAITIGYTILNWGHRRIIPEITDTTLTYNLPFSTIQGEAFCCMGSPRWVDRKNPWMATIPKAYLEVIRGNASVKMVKRSTIAHEFIIDAKTDVLIRENTLYFPGWRVFDNGKEIEIQYTNVKPSGIMHMKLSKGLHLLSITYEDLTLHKLTKYVAIFTFLLLILYLSFAYLRKRIFAKLMNLL